MTGPLAGLSVAVTRPAHQAAELVDTFIAHGAQALSVPLLAFSPVAQAEQVNDVDRILSELNQADFAVFISRNAADFLLSALQARKLEWPAQLQAFTVGHPTANYLISRGINCQYPTERLDSEGLLALPALQDVAGKRGIIFRADIGRELLAQTLTERGAQIEKCVLYTRHCPTDAAQHWQQFLNLPAKQRAICLNSQETINHWLQIAPSAAQLNITAVVPAARLRDNLLQRGMSQVLLAADATDASMLNTLLAWYRP